MLEQPTLVKRPVVEIDEDLLIGFSADRLRETLERHGLVPPDEAADASLAGATGEAGR